MSGQNIILNFTVPPGIDDLQALTQTVWETLPDDLSTRCAELTFEIEDMADDTTLRDYDLDDPFELIALYKSGNEISPGIESKTGDNEDVLVIYRRAFLDMWCETEDDLEALMRQVIIEELGRYFEFSDQDVQDMVEQSYGNAA